VSGQSQLFYSITLWAYPVVAPRRMVTLCRDLRSAQHGEYQTLLEHHCDVRYRRRLASRYAHGLAPVTSPWRWLPWSGALLMEAGVMLLLLGAVHQSTNAVSLREGVIWLVLATVAAVVPTVSLIPVIFSLPFDTPGPFVRQVFVCLNLNG
jgi:hypothetical protein